MENLRYFLGANSPSSFYGYFQRAYGPDWKVWLIKGGPGSGKSTMMKRAAEMAGGQWEYIHCSSDPKSVDAIIQPEKKLMVADATAPHTMDPLHPGCVEQIINMGQGFDIAALRCARERIQQLCGENAAQHRAAVRYLAAAAAVKTARYRAAEEKLHGDALRQLAADWCNRQYPCTGQQGREVLRGLCAVTPEGVLFYDSTVAAVADTVYLLQDERGAAAPVFLLELRRQLLARGYAVTVCRCSLFPDSCIEHLLLPCQRVAFVTANSAHTYAADRCQVIDLGRYYTGGANVRELSPLQAQEKSMIAAAADSMFRARQLHDELEQYYIAAMDFAFAQQQTLALAQQLQQ